MSALKQQLTDAMKTALKAHEKARLGAVRLLIAAVKQREIDDRVELDDQQIIVILDKEAKKRRESITLYEQADRQDLADQEKFELEIIQEFLPKALGPEEITALIDKAMQETQASSMRDMGKVMAILKPQLQGRADMSAVSQAIKAKLV